MKPFVLVTVLVAFVACERRYTTNDQAVSYAVKKGNHNPPSIEEKKFGQLPDGRPVSLFTLRNANGLTTEISNYGGLIVSLWTLDREEIAQNIVLGYDSLETYLKSSPFFGALVGRYANRISHASFTLDGKLYPLAANNGTNSIHGGKRGFDKALWDATPLNTTDGPSLILRYKSKDMEEGFPGNLDVKVTYTFTNANELVIDYEATTDKATIVNLTQHTYFNLSGNAKRDILDEELMIPADSIVEIDSIMISTGRLIPVKNTAFDFTKPRVIGDSIDSNNDQIKKGQGYDHCFVLRNDEKKDHWAASLYDPVSGRVMDVTTDLPGVQVYSGNHLSKRTGKLGAIYTRRGGICFETGLYPDTPNRPEFPPAVLRPGQTYKTRTKFSFYYK